MWISTEAGKVAYTADEIVVRLNELQDAAINAEATKGLDTATTRTFVQFVVSAEKTLAATPAGWQQTVSIAWRETKAQLPAITNQTVRVAIAALDAALASLGV